MDNSHERALVSGLVPVTGTLRVTRLGGIKWRTLDPDLRRRRGQLREPAADHRCCCWDTLSSIQLLMGQDILSCSRLAGQGTTPTYCLKYFLFYTFIITFIQHIH
jgi:hypothetical protein